MPIKFKPIVPKKKFNEDAFINSLTTVPTDISTFMTNDFDKTHNNWSAKSQPQTIVKVERKSNGILSALVELKGKVYSILHQGINKRYPIVAKRAKMLKFQGGYKAKTKVGRLASRGGGSFGPTEFKEAVIHPGFPGRFWDKLVAVRAEKKLVKLTEKAMNNGTKKSGHIFK